MMKGSSKTSLKNPPKFSPWLRFGPRESRELGHGWQVPRIFLNRRYPDPYPSLGGASQGIT